MNQKEISDLGLIAALITLGYQQIEVYKQGRRVLFVFEWDDHMQSIEDQYFSNSLEVDAQTYSSVLRRVKGMIYKLEPDQHP